LVLRSDGLPAGRITKWEWKTGASKTFLAGYFENFKLTLCHTDLTSLTNNYVNNYRGRTPVHVINRSRLNVNSTPPETWVAFPFDAPFDYNGGDNLVVEVWWHGDNGAGGSARYGNAGGGNRQLYSGIYNGNPYAGYPNTGYTTQYMHYMRITLTASAVDGSSVGRIKYLFN
jgi:hypothetical protein